MILKIIVLQNSWLILVIIKHWSISYHKSKGRKWNLCPFKLLYSMALTEIHQKSKAATKSNEINSYYQKSTTTQNRNMRNPICASGIYSPDKLNPDIR